MTVDLKEPQGTENPSNKGDYDPFAHRKVEKPNSDVRAAANLIKSSLGSGLLAGPLAFANSGWGIGIIGTILVGIICGHCIHILVETSRGCCKIEKKPSLDYAETCKSAFTNGPKCLRPLANFARLYYFHARLQSIGNELTEIHQTFLNFLKLFDIVTQIITFPCILMFLSKKINIFTEFSLISTYVGVCCIYTILIADSIKQIVDRYAPSYDLPVEYYCLIFLLPLILLCQIRYLKFLAIFSLLANILLFTVYLICLYYIFGDEIRFTDKIVIGDPARYPAFISTVIFAMEGVGVVMPVENAMKKPQHFLGCPSVLVVAMGVIVFLYSTLGLFGYFRYGDVLRGSITLNLPMDDWPAVCAKVFIALSIFFTYPLQFFVVIDIFTKYTQPYVKEKYQRVTQVAARTIGVCCCVGIGIALPLLEQIINLVGACFYSILGLIIPCVIETVFRWENLGKFKWVLWKNLLIIACGLLALISGCTVTIMDIIEILHKRKNLN